MNNIKLLFIYFNIFNYNLYKNDISVKYIPSINYFHFLKLLMNIINHRIDRCNENRVSSINNMINNKIYNFEIDINMCNDELILFHDSQIEDNGNIYDISDICYNELNNVDKFDDLIKYLNNISFLDKQINDLHIYIDIKGTNQEIIKLIINKLNFKKNTYNGIHFYFQTFNHNFITELQRQNINQFHKIGFITYGYSPYIPLGIDYLVIDKQFIKLYTNYMESLYRTNQIKNLIPLYAYTVNSKDEITNFLINNDLSGIFTDYPERFIN